MTNIDVRPDYGKDDEGLLAGHYAEACGHIAGPATSAREATAALLRHLDEEGHTMPGDEPKVHTWQVRAKRKAT